MQQHLHLHGGLKKQFLFFMLPTCFLSVVGADKVLHSFFFKLNGVEEVLAK